MTSFNIDDATVGRLQDLLSINIDSQRGFEEAAETTNDPELKNLFRDFSQRRAHNAAELRQCISAAGKQPTNTGSVSATLHRWWIDAKQAVTGKDAGSILTEAERGEDSIKHEYESALKDVADVGVRDVVERQYRNVKEGHDRVKALRDTYKARNPRD
jgi:uncharacterized protein (TIGR02284 family)